MVALRRSTRNSSQRAARWGFWAAIWVSTQIACGDDATATATHVDDVAEVGTDGPDDGGTDDGGTDDGDPPVPSSRLSGYSIFRSSTLVVPGHLGSGLLGSLSDVVFPEGSSAFTRSIGDYEAELGYSPMRLAWEAMDADARVGVAISPRAQSVVREKLGDQAPSDRPLDRHVLNLDDVNSPLHDSPLGPGSVESVDALCYRARNETAVPVTVHIEIKNPRSELPAGSSEEIRKRTATTTLDAAQHWQERCVAFDEFEGTGDFDASRLDEVVLYWVPDDDEAPTEGALSLEEIWFDGPHVVTQDALLELTERERLEYLMFKAAAQMVQLASPEDDSRGLAQDRNSFGDLFSVAAQGFLFASLPDIVDRAWYSREEAAELTARGLRRLSQCADSAFESPPWEYGYCKHRGLFYHFLGSDGARKRNFDFEQTEDVDESTNTVELSIIDTGLLLIGAHVAETYFDADDATEQEIRDLARELREAVDWRWVYSFSEEQLFVDWRPSEEAVVPAPIGCWGNSALTDCSEDQLGYFSARPASEPGDDATACPDGSPQSVSSRPFTLDYFTSELIIPNVFALARSAAERPPSGLWSSMDGCDDQGCLASSGAVFVYQFDALLGLPTTLLPLASGTSVHEQACSVHAAALQADAETCSLPGAHENPFQGYVANSCAETLNDDFAPQSDGGVAPYAWVGAFACGEHDVHADARRGLEELLQHYPAYSPLTGLADVVYPEIPTPPAAIPDARQQGLWVNYAAFGIDQGPIVLGLNKALCQMDEDTSSRCQQRLRDSEVVATALDVVSCAPGSTDILEGEWSTVNGCGRSEESVAERCEQKLCEVDMDPASQDSFPVRDGLSGDMALHIFSPGTVARFPAVHASGPSEATLVYSLSWPAELAAQVELRVCWGEPDGDNCSTITGLEPTSSWTATGELTVSMPALGPDCASQRLHVVLDSVPEEALKWGIQIDRVAIETLASE